MRTVKQESRSLMESAYRVLKEEIVSHRLPPGVPVNMKEFTRRLGLSRTPLREAILRLEEEGFIEIRPRMGTFVSHLDLRQIRDMYQVRQVLEGLAARLAVELMASDQLLSVEQELRRHPGKVPDYPAISRAGQRLHDLIIESCGNRVLTHQIKSLQDHFTRFRNVSLQIPEKILSSHKEHLEILKALQKRDGLLAERLIHQHFEHAARFLLESLLARTNRRQEIPVTISHP